MLLLFLAVLILVIYIHVHYFYIIYLQNMSIRLIAYNHNFFMYFE